MKLSELGEREIIRKYILPMLSTEMGNVLLDDCAVIDLGGPTPYLLSVDQGPHRTFLESLGVGTPADIAHFHVTINVSDIAAMGGVPIALLLAFGARADDTEEYLMSYFAGFKDALKEYRIALIGGDTKQSPYRSATITVLGRSSSPGPLLRTGTQVGDQIFITGELLGETLRSYIMAARAIRIQKPKSEHPVLRPRAKISFGKSLATSRICSACIDMSDGLLASAEQLAVQNGVTFRIFPELVAYVPSPKAEAIEQWINLLFNVGGDFGLMFTIPSAYVGRAEKMGARRIGEVAPWEGRPVATEALHRWGIEIRAWEQFRTIEPITNEILSLV